MFPNWYGLAFFPVVVFCGMALAWIPNMSTIWKAAHAAVLLIYLGFTIYTVFLS